MRDLLLQAVEEAPTTTNGIDVVSLLGPILATGIGGVLFVMVAFQIGIVSKKTYDQLRTDHERALVDKDKTISNLTEANQSLRKLTEEQIIPALVRANQLSADYASDLADERRRRRRGDET